METSGMNKGWILVKDKFWDSYETERLVEEFHSQNINVQLVDPNTIDIFVNKENKKSIVVNGNTSELPRFVFPRTGSGTTYHIKAVIRHFERMGVPVINSSDAIDNVKDKLYTHQILAQSNLDIPKTMLLKHPIDVEFVEKNIGFPAIIKTISGSYGRGVFLAENKKQLKQLLTMAELTKKSYNIVIQEFIKDTWGKDLRVLVVNNKVVGCMMRQAQDDDFRANITRGGEGFPYEVNEQIEWLSVESSKALDLDIAGVDLLFDNGGYKICEVNSNPGFEGMEVFTKKNIAGEIVSFIKLKIGVE
jgi:gamma-F420-2:alpha-L-glutamate ligase